MRKVLFIVVLGILISGVGGCGSPEATEEATPTPSPESSPESVPETTEPEDSQSEAPDGAEEKAEENAEENAEETAEEKEAFEEPLVAQQKEETAAKAGLIQSTNPDERLRQLKGSLNGNGTATPTAVAGVPPQSVSDPFGVLPPQILEQTPDADEGVESLELNPRQVPSFPDIPVAQRPTPWMVATQPTNEGATPPATQTVTLTPAPTGGGTPTPTVGQPNRPGTPQSPDLPRQQVPALPQLPTAGQPPTNQPSQPGGIQSPDLVARQVPDLPQLPKAERPTQFGARPVAAKPQPGTPSPGGQPQAPRTEAQTGGQSPTPRAGLAPTPTAPTPLPAEPPPPPTIPDLTVAQVPELPPLPNTEPLPQWFDPNVPPAAAVPSQPPPPSIDLAKGMEVTGVMQAGEQTRVILKAPSEPTSRYVNVGQRVANGEVLVKRVKFSAGSEPIVIFEQNGVEVAVEVGTTPPPADEQLNLIIPPAPTINAFNASSSS